jgi:beta-glucosidase
MGDQSTPTVLEAPPRTTPSSGEEPTASPRPGAISSLGPGFTWGVSTSSYQVEGACREDGRGPSIWDSFCRQTGRIVHGDTGDVACDHYHRFKEDIALMRDIGVGAYRFSVAWPRLLPGGRGTLNEPGAAFYDRLIDGLLAAGIEPWLCLYHWDLPQALDDLGGWLQRDSAGWFADYAAIAARRYGDRVKRFATFNEPSVFTLFGYGMGWQAPGIADIESYCRAVHHVNLAHGLAVDVVRSHVCNASIGAIHNRQPCFAAGGEPADQAAAALLDACWNQAFADPQILGSYPPALARLVEPYQMPGDLSRICRTVDWFGLNHYSPLYAKATIETPLGFTLGAPPNDAQRSAIGWHVAPQAFRDTLTEAYRRYRLPIFVLENGCGTHDQRSPAGEVVDRERVEFLERYTAAMREAIAAGADVRGYFVWSLLDNFEWGAGYRERFGLVYVDYPSLRRIPKASARWYTQLIARERHPYR